MSRHHDEKQEDIFVLVLRPPAAYAERIGDARREGRSLDDRIYLRDGQYTPEGSIHRQQIQPTSPEPKRIPDGSATKSTKATVRGIHPMYSKRHHYGHASPDLQSWVCIGASRAGPIRRCSRSAQSTMTCISIRLYLPKRSTACLRGRLSANVHSASRRLRSILGNGFLTIISPASPDSRIERPDSGSAMSTSIPRAKICICKTISVKVFRLLHSASSAYFSCMNGSTWIRSDQ